MTGRLEGLLEDKKRNQQAEQGQRREEREAWVRSVKALLDRLEEWLHPLASKGYLTPLRREITIHEQAVGDYTSEQLRLEFVGGQLIEIHPVGRYVVGAHGRVDLKAGLRTIMLIRKENDTWELAEREGRGRSKSWPLTKETFEELLADIIEET